MKKSELSRDERLKSVGDLLVETAPFSEATKILRRTYLNWGSRPEGTCAFVVGASGAGKTTVADDFLSETARELGTEYIAETSADASGRWGLIKETEGGFIRPVLKVFVGPRIMFRGLFFDLLLALGVRANRNANFAELMSLVMRHLRAQQVKLIIFDETHHIIDRHTTTTAYEAADLLKMLLIQSQVQIVCLGLPHSLEILKANDQLGRRCTARYEIRAFRDDVEDAEGDFMQFIAALESALPFDMPSGLDRPSRALRLHHAGSGYIGRITHIAQTATELAVDRGLSHLTAELLAEAYKNISTIDDDVNPFLVEEFRPEEFAIHRARLEARKVEPERGRGRKTPVADFTK